MLTFNYRAVYLPPILPPTLHPLPGRASASASASGFPAPTGVGAALHPPDRPSSPGFHTRARERALDGPGTSLVWFSRARAGVGPKPRARLLRWVFTRTRKSAISYIMLYSCYILQRRSHTHTRGSSLYVASQQTRARCGSSFPGAVQHILSRTRGVRGRLDITGAR